MIWTPIDTWICVIASLCAAACVLPGCILVLRRMSLMGDAISHTVLPGIAIAFLVTGSREPTAMLIGAVIIGLLTAFLVQAIETLGKIETGAAIGIVFTVLFAAGLVLMRQAVDHVDIDPDCVLYGAVEFAYFDQITIGSWAVPRAAVVNGVALIANAIIILIFYKEFKITSFDSALAMTQGIRPSTMHYLLMTMTAATAVAAFETVGSILVIAMLIVPASAAYLLTDKYGAMFLIAIAIAIVGSIGGHISAVTIPPVFGFSGTSTAGAMAVVVGFLFFLTWIFSPKHGVWSAAMRRKRVQQDIIREDILGLLWRLEERSRENSDISFENALCIPKRSVKRAIRHLQKLGKICLEYPLWRLTEQGRKEAALIVRSHRLWETYLDKHFPQDVYQLHQSAERLEHVTSTQMQSRLGDAEKDPHGSKVPPSPDN
ncbi:MAG TPA: metal ABC transporter permease [Phycisphaerales bacterium]|nr:metal ABC transporter permease [Phycisphaerales bacterium]